MASVERPLLGLCPRCSLHRHTCTEIHKSFLHRIHTWRHVQTSNGVIHLITTQPPARIINPPTNKTSSQSHVYSKSLSPALGIMTLQPTLSPLKWPKLRANHPYKNSKHLFCDLAASNVNLSSTRLGPFFLHFP